MSFQAIALNVLIASPGDTGPARDAVERVVRLWNTDRSRESKVVLLPLRWEIDSVAELGAGRGQGIINRQLVDEADIVIGLFDSRLGTPTINSVSGTAEELERSYEGGARVHVYFSEGPLDRRVDTLQLQALDAFKHRLEEHGLLGTYYSTDDLAVHVRTALEKDVNRLVRTSGYNGKTIGAVGPRAVLRAFYRPERDSSHGASQAGSQTRGSRIEVENVGSVVAEHVRLTVQAAGGGDPPIQRFDELDITRIEPLSSSSYPVYIAIGTATRWKVHMSWEEGGECYSETQIVNAGRRGDAKGP